MKFVYPSPNHRTFEASTFLLGAVQPGQTLYIQEIPVPTSASGAFAWKVDLLPGENQVKLKVTGADHAILLQDSMSIYRELPHTPPPPLTLDPETFSPQGHLLLKPGDFLNISCIAAANTQIRCVIPGLADAGFPLRQASKNQKALIDNRTAVFAALHQTSRPIPQDIYYSGQFQIPWRQLPLEKAPLMLHLSHAEGSQTLQMPTELSVLETPFAATVRTHHAILRTAPGQGSRLTPQPLKTTVFIDGSQSGWYRIRLSESQSAWISQEDVFLEGVPTAPRPGPMQMPVFMAKTHAVSPVESEVHIPLQSRIPLHIETDPHHLRLHLYGGVSHCDFLHMGPGECVVESIQWQQPQPDAMRFDLSVPGLCGYRYDYTQGASTPYETETTLVLSLKKLPKRLGDIRILIDPGHGGEEPGATALCGIPEKDLNLSISRLLARELESDGFQVHLTRTGDETVTLDKRRDLVETVQADLCISLHHNALPDGRDPLNARGASCYYYHPFARALAKTLQTALVSDLDLPDYGLLYDSLAMTRIHEATAVLVELGFLTHPEEHDRIITPTFQEAAARSLAQAILRYCQKEI